MKTLSVRQPWANLIVHGIKDVENRTWKTNSRGRIYIHAPAKVHILTEDDLPLKTRGQWIIDNFDLTYKGVDLYPESFLSQWADLWDNQFTSAIVGSVEIVDCIRDSKSVWADPDCWHWVLKDPILIDEPILNVKGKLSLWEYEC